MLIRCKHAPKKTKEGRVERWGGVRMRGERGGQRIITQEECNGKINLHWVFSVPFIIWPLRFPIKGKIRNIYQSPYHPLNSPAFPPPVQQNLLLIYSPLLFVLIKIVPFSLLFILGIFYPSVWYPFLHVAVGSRGNCRKKTSKKIEI